MIVQEQLSPRETISKNFQTDAAAAAASTERLKDYPEFNHAECVMDPAVAASRQSVLSAHRSSVCPSLLKTMTDGTRTSTATTAWRMMSRVIAEMSSRPLSVYLLTVVFLSLLHTVDLMAFFYRRVCKWMRSYSFTNKLLSLREPALHRRRLTRHPFY